MSIITNTVVLQRHQRIKSLIAEYLKHYDVSTVPLNDHLSAILNFPVIDSD